MDRLATTSSVVVHNLHIKCVAHALNCSLTGGYLFGVSQSKLYTTCGQACPNCDLPWTVHGAIFAYGVALLDNALLEPLAQVCAEEGRYEFMLTIVPLNIEGGTGSPANPIALF